jgi:hypothetical protein
LQVPVPVPGQGQEPVPEQAVLSQQVVQEEAKQPVSSHIPIEQWRQK